MHRSQSFISFFFLIVVIKLSYYPHGDMKAENETIAFFVRFHNGSPDRFLNNTFNL